MMNIRFSKLQMLLIVFASASLDVTAFAHTEMTYMIPKGTGEYIQENVILQLDKAKLDIRVNLQGVATATLDYRLPQEVDGPAAKRFRPSGTMREDGSWFLTEAGQDANGNAINIVEATCTGNEDDFNCRMQYAKNADNIFALNLDAARDYLATRTDLSLEQITKIEGAQMALSHEAIGIVHAKKSRHGGHN